ncbi:hypothetical protein GMORB2_4368 [Geosmithia morbida]|uniref:Uncharacterized protein n=1 Tax=Geosmithia morbida TaxID=1094350 RepID=A0A9P4YYP5_9HYPO|nr:uncharacterized protein GMORB2_4368 [Geosmithia morbida]KAF4125528.1 hypothetical protein GMORB2_4368 [Geosmithia morbida]
MGSVKVGFAVQVAITGSLNDHIVEMDDTYGSLYVEQQLKRQAEADQLQGDSGSDFELVSDSGAQSCLAVETKATSSLAAKSRPIPSPLSFIESLRGDNEESVQTELVTARKPLPKAMGDRRASSQRDFFEVILEDQGTTSTSPSTPNSVSSVAVNDDTLVTSPNKRMATSSPGHQPAKKHRTDNQNETAAPDVIHSTPGEFSCRSEGVGSPSESVTLPLLKSTGDISPRPGTSSMEWAAGILSTLESGGKSYRYAVSNSDTISNTGKHMANEELRSPPTSSNVSTSYLDISPVQADYTQATSVDGTNSLYQKRGFLGDPVNLHDLAQGTKGIRAPQFLSMSENLLNIPTSNASETLLTPATPLWTQVPVDSIPPRDVSIAHLINPQPARSLVDHILDDFRRYGNVSPEELSYAVPVALDRYLIERQRSGAGNISTKLSSPGTTRNAGISSNNTSGPQNSTVANEFQVSSRAQPVGSTTRATPSLTCCTPTLAEATELTALRFQNVVHSRKVDEISNDGNHDLLPNAANDAPASTSSAIAHDEHSCADADSFSLNDG